MKKIVFSICCMALVVVANAQYQFKEKVKVACTPVKSQDNTGTCWSFATASFIESEVMKKGHPAVDLSEMYVVRNIYQDKATNYILRQGKANFSQGSLSHDLIRIMDKAGVMPESVYSGKLSPDAKHDHNELEAGLKGYLDGVLSTKSPSPLWRPAFNAILETYLGKQPSEFIYNGIAYSPKSYADSLGIKASDYVGFTSFTHHPFNEPFILEIPDNYSNGSYMNIPIDQLMATINKALDMGYTVAWDGDVSEKGFSAKNGVAVMPLDKRDDVFTRPGMEVTANQEERQKQFENLQTTDDHLMHLVGRATDQRGTNYYIIKNSWGEISDYKGYLYMSEAYVKMKTVAIYVNKAVLE